MAFGTGHHGTTLGCLRMIARLAEEGQIARVADIGCGTAVLAMAAARIWPDAHVIASDIDPVAVEVALSNLKANDLSHIACLEAGGFDHPDLASRAPYDLIIANILKGPLIALAPDIAAASAPGAKVILSGILTTQADETAEVFFQNGFSLVAQEEIVDWSTLLLAKSGLENDAR